jgi:hypothetical protein
VLTPSTSDIRMSECKEKKGGEVQAQRRPGALVLRGGEEPQRHMVLKA